LSKLKRHKKKRRMKREMLTMTKTRGKILRPKRQQMRPINDRK